MARFKPYDLNQTKMIPLSYADQVVEGSFEFALNEIVEQHLDLSVFEGRYANDDTGCPLMTQRSCSRSSSTATTRGFFPAASPRTQVMTGISKIGGAMFGRGVNLSFQARTALAVNPIVREADWTVPTSVLAHMLEARGLPVLPELLAIEVAVGGALLPSGRLMGIFASLRHIEGQGELPPGHQDFPVGHPRMSSRQLRSSQEGPMLPLVLRDDPELWIDAAGAVHFVNTDDDYGYHTKAFDTFARYVEVFAFLRESLVWPPEHALPRVHRLFSPVLAAESLAEALGAWVVEEASGPTSRTWARDDLHIAELRIPGFVDGTHVGAPEASDILTAVASLDPRSADIEWQCPVSARSAAWTVAGLPPPTHTFKHQGSAVHAWGTVPHYDFEMKKRWAGALPSRARVVNDAESAVVENTRLHARELTLRVNR